MSNIQVTRWVMTAQSEPCVMRQENLDAPAAGEAIVEVAGCGVCHTDISFLHQGVPTRAEMPLALGHEISGKVVQLGAGADEGLLGSTVMVPAVMPCGECELCRNGHRRICRAQVMPGNDRHGGFATHVTVPARYLCPIPENVLANHELWELSVVADAITTPFQAVRSSELTAGDLAICIGTGGIGIHGVQIAAAVGAKVIALDIDDDKLAVAAEYGADAVINTKGLDIREIKGQVKAAAKEMGAPSVRWRIYETSGTKPGQETAFALVNQGAHLSVVGFTMAKQELRLSNLMAFDATVQGNWGCDAALYPEVLQWIGDGRIKVSPFVEKFALEDINSVLDAAHAGTLKRRGVLVP
ncbi:MAG: 6-hydroxycyclohex-1-ene-1-carbonyl-CoA dehydrogenase [bacterium]|nr:6-hydroxycyclohex-1-ene-1-carbonyl-CoA dehydrogenase [bacterium]